MIVIIQKDTQEPALRQLAVRLMNQGVRIGRTPGRDADVLTLVGDTWRLDPEGLAALPYVLDVRRITPPYRLAGRAAHPDNTVVEVGSARIGAEFCLIAGPCAVESQVQMAGVARRVKAAGAQLLRGGVFKPRTSPYSFQGLGQAGISMLTEAGHEAGLPVVTEITDSHQLEDLDQVDILQVGARNMQNFALLQALGQVRKPVLLKRGMSSTVTELLQAAEYILAGGNERVILCERGIRTFETDSRATLDIAAIPVLKKMTHLPVIVDPSHAAGRAELVARVRAVLNRTMPRTEASDSTMTFGELSIDTASHTVKVSGEEVSLTPKEFDLLVFLASNKGIALSREKILQKVWNYDYFGEDRTVDTHVKMLRGHLGKCRSYIATVWGIGYKFDPDATR